MRFQRYPTYVFGVRSILLALSVCMTSVFPALGGDVQKISVWGEELTLDGADLRWGKREVHPYATSQWSFTDNVYLSKHDRKADHFLTLVPGVLVRNPIGESHYLQARLESRFFRYFDQTDLNILREHEATVQARFDFGRYKVDLSNVYEYLDQVADIQFSSRQTRTINTSNMKTQFVFDPVTLQVGYTRAFRRWLRRVDAYLDHTEDIASIGLDFKAPAQMRPSLRYEFSDTDYDGDTDGRLKRLNDQQRHSVLAGVRSAVGGFFQWSVEGGAAQVYLRKRTNLFEPLSGHTRSTHLVGNARGTWNLRPERTKLSFAVSRNVIPSAEADYMSVLTFDLNFEHRWTRRLTTRASASYGYYNRPKGQDFQRYDAEAGVTYRITRWASVFSRYRYGQRDALGDKSGEADHSENEVTLGFSFAF